MGQNHISYSPAQGIFSSTDSNVLGPSKARKQRDTRELNYSGVIREKKKKKKVELGSINMSKSVFVRLRREMSGL